MNIFLVVILVILLGISMFNTVYYYDVECNVDSNIPCDNVYFHKGNMTDVIIDVENQHDYGGTFDRFIVYKEISYDDSKHKCYIAMDEFNHIFEAEEEKEELMKDLEYEQYIDIYIYKNDAYNSVGIICYTYYEITKHYLYYQVDVIIAIIISTTLFCFLILPLIAKKVWSFFSVNEYTEIVNSPV